MSLNLCIPAIKKFYKGLKEFYSKDRLLSMNEELYLEDIVARFDIDRYQLERMRIDIMSRHIDNKSVVDEYRDILLGGILKDTMQHSEYARLNRLRPSASETAYPTYFSKRSMSCS